MRGGGATKPAARPARKTARDIFKTRSKLVDYLDAIDEVLEKAAMIKLPHHRLDVVTVARREFAKHGSCDAKLITPIERTLMDCLRAWTLEQKREIWLSTETGAQSDWAVEAYEESSIDMDLEGELLAQIIEELSPVKNRYDSKGNDDFDGPDQTPPAPSPLTSYACSVPRTAIVKTVRRRR